MAVRKIYDTREDGSKSGEDMTLYEGCVISHSSHYRHVHSDNAMIDSGYCETATVWDGNNVTTLTFDMGRSCYHVVIEDDATEEVLELVARWRKVRAMLEAVYRETKRFSDALKEAGKVRRGVRVEVFKGRKVPKDVYWVVQMGEGQYGPYVELSDEPNGRSDVYYRYVSSDNVRVENPQQYVTPFTFPENDLAVSELTRTIALAWVNGGKYSREDQRARAADLNALADAITDAGGSEETAEVLSWMACKHTEPLYA